MSKYEEDIKNLLIAHNVKFTENDVIQITPYELDFYIPDLNLGIEINSLYHHSLKLGNGKSDTYHYDKSSLCKEKGINLIQLYNDELLDIKTLWKHSMHTLMYHLNISKEIKVNSSTYIKSKVSFEEAMNFYNINKHSTFEPNDTMEFKIITTSGKIGAILAYNIINDDTLIIHDYNVKILHSHDIGFKLLISSIFLNSDTRLSQAYITLDIDKYGLYDNFVTRIGFIEDEYIPSKAYVCSDDYNSIVDEYDANKLSKLLLANKSILFKSGQMRYKLIK